MNPERGRNLNVIASVGLTLGGVFGLAGTFAGQANLRNLAWEIDGLGLIVATSLLAIKFFRKGCDAIAAGFLVFAIGESVMLSGRKALTPLSSPLPFFGYPFLVITFAGWIWTLLRENKLARAK